jgi:hypothetical protein
VTSWLLTLTSWTSSSLTSALIAACRTGAPIEKLVVRFYARARVHRVHMLVLRWRPAKERV